MLPKVMLHKRNGHRRPAPSRNPSLGDMLRLVHSSREVPSRPGYNVLKFASVVQSEKTAALLEQAAREIDSLQIALGAVLAQTTERFAQGELADVRGTLEAFRSQAELSSQVMTRLMAAAGARAAERRLVSLNELLAEVIEELSARPGPEVSILSHRDLELPWVAGNPRQIQQVVQTLLVHAHRAAQAGQPPATIVVRTSREPGVLTGEDVACLRVTCDGMPFAPEVLAVVTRSGAGPAALPEGPDLDLYIACQIVAEHGGVLSAQNLPEGGRFTVELPSL